MENNYYSPVQILENNIKAGINKANMGLLKMILLGMFAGMFIAIGAEGSNLAAHNLTGVGVARTLTGVIFPIGLMMLVVTGGELFTGNCMLTMALADHKIKALQMIKNWVVVYFSNMLGSTLTAACVYASEAYTQAMLPVNMITQMEHLVHSRSRLPWVRQISISAKQSFPVSFVIFWYVSQY